MTASYDLFIDDGASEKYYRTMEAGEQYKAAIREHFRNHEPVLSIPEERWWGIASVNRPLTLLYPHRCGLDFWLRYPSGRITHYSAVRGEFAISPADTYDEDV